MLLFSICLLGLLGVSLVTFAEPRQKPTSARSAYAVPPAGWPDVPAYELGVFQPMGRINAAMPKIDPTVEDETVLSVSSSAQIETPCVSGSGTVISRSGFPKRLRTFEAAQDLVVDLVDPWSRDIPEIALELSERDGPEWTNVKLNGAVVAQVPTSDLESRKATYTVAM